MKTYNETIEFLNQLEKGNLIDLNDSLSNYINEQDFEYFDQLNPANALYELIEEAGGFNTEVIYYHNAIDYLKENDPSLRESLDLVDELGYDIRNINSEVLASLLKSQNERENFDRLRGKIEGFFNN
jgi:nitric oxide synthase oxygenase domain/subunit